MDINDLRTAMTVLSFIAFVGIVVWAYGRKRRRDFDEAAGLPFTGEDPGEDRVRGAQAAKEGAKR